MKSVSVIIPTYKNRGGVVRSIQSVLEQDYLGLKEIIVVDDNAPESEYRKDTEKLMCQFSNTPKVIYIKHPENRNGAAARNTGIKASRGEYIAFLDDDDKYLPGKLKKQVAYLNDHPEYDAVYCQALRKGKEHKRSFYQGDATKQMLLLETFMQTSLLMFRREALLSIQGFDEGFRRHQDYDVMLRFFHKGYKIGCLPEPLVEIGINDGENIPSGKKLEEMKSFFFDKFMPYIDEINKEEKGFKNKVLAKHYAGVFLNHVKHKEIKMAIKTFCRYAVCSPAIFFKVIIDSAIIHLKGEA